MSRVTIELSAKGDSDWAVHKNGTPIAWFMGTNACERFIAVEKAIESARRSSKVTGREARRIHALLNRGR